VPSCLQSAVRVYHLSTWDQHKDMTHLSFFQRGYFIEYIWVYGAFIFFSESVFHRIHMGIWCIDVYAYITYPHEINTNIRRMYLSFREYFIEYIQRYTRHRFIFIWVYPLSTSTWNAHKYMTYVRECISSNIFRDIHPYEYKSMTCIPYPHPHEMHTSTWHMYLSFRESISSNIFRDIHVIDWYSYGYIPYPHPHEMHPCIWHMYLSFRKSISSNIFRDIHVIDLYSYGYPPDPINHVCSLTGK